MVGLTRADELARSYLLQHGDAESAIKMLVRWQVEHSTALGFCTNIGGLLTLPIAIPLDIGETAVLQLRMIAAIAQLRGYKIRSHQVRTFAIMCLIGNAAVEVLKKFGITVGTKMAAQGVGRISGQTLLRINQAVGFRLVTKAGVTGATNLLKWVPLVGGMVGGTIDGMTTYAAAEAAMKVFPSMALDLGIEALVIEGKPIS